MKPKKQYYAKIRSKSFIESELGWEKYRELLTEAYLKTEEYLFERGAILRESHGDSCQAVLCVDGIAVDYRYYKSDIIYKGRGSDGLLYVLLGSDVKPVKELAGNIGKLSDLLEVDI